MRKRPFHITDISGKKSEIFRFDIFVLFIEKQIEISFWSNLSFDWMFDLSGNELYNQLHL